MDKRIHNPKAWPALPFAKPSEKPSEAAGLRFLSEGFVCPTKRGELTVTLQNPTENKIFLSAGSVVGFVVLTPFVK